MESSKSNYLDVTDSIFDDPNIYNLLYNNVADFGLENRNDLYFNGEIESAKQYSNNESPDFIDFCNHEVSSIDVDHENESKHTTSQCLENTSSIGPISITSSSSSSVGNYEALSLSPSFNSETKSVLTDFQREREPRIKYLLRSPKVWQECTNSGNLEKLKTLFDDILSEDCIQLNGFSPPIVGREKIYNVQVSIQRNIPDFCVFYSNIVRSKKRLITMKGNSFGSFPYANSSCDKTVNAWNFFETTPYEMLDEYHKLQKQKYDTLKSQNKIIKFERRATWHIILSRDLRHIIKLMTYDVKNDIF